MRIRVFVALVFGLVVSLGAPIVVAAQEPVTCGPGEEKHQIIKHRGQHPVPAPSAGKSMIAIALGKSISKSFQRKLAVNGQWRAVLEESQYSFFEVDPGILRLCWGGRFVPRRDHAYLLITARPDETYYIRGTVKRIVEVDPVEGRKLLHKKTYATYEIRQ